LHYVIKLFAKTSKPRNRTLGFLEIMDKMQDKTMSNEYNGEGNSFGISLKIYPYYGIPKGYLKPM
jgi:hypothetical protein